MLSINTNLQSLIAQKSLSNSTLLLNQAIERMTTGYKINHAKDNAANYAIATDLSTKIGAYQVAEDNCSMGLDMITTASESLNLMSNGLARLRALAEQANNGTYGKQSINAINSEARAIMDELFRTKNNTEYNGKKLFGESVGPDMSKLAVNESGFIENVQKRNTADMTSLESVNESAVLAKGTYSISSADELAKLARMQNAGKITDGSEFVLGADIDLSGYANWTPIGWENGNTQTDKAFSGTFDGNGYTIKNLTSKQSGDSAAGLFGCADNATFKNIGIENTNLNGKFAASLLGYGYLKNNNNLTIYNCYSTNGNISGIGNNSTIGGLIGGVGASNYSVNETNIISCYTKGMTETCEGSAAGGIIGDCNKANIKNCFSIFNITTNSNNICSGGIFGKIDIFNIENCFAKGELKSLVENGLVSGGIGNGDGEIKNCYFQGTISGKNHSSGSIVGGCLGNESVYIDNCSANANIAGTQRVGGIIGWQDGEGGLVKNCHFNGTISGTGSSTAIGSIVGGGVEDKLTIQDCTYNKSLTGELITIGDNLGTSINVTDMVLTTNLQVGIHGDENSQIDFDTFLQLDEIRSLYINGLKQENVFETIDNLSQKISATQTQLGSVENRLESVLEEISTHYENLSSSRSTLKDADIAEVSSQYIQKQILQQASATLLATANQTPAIALQLI